MIKQRAHIPYYLERYQEPRRKWAGLNVVAERDGGGACYLPLAGWHYDCGKQISEVSVVKELLQKILSRYIPLRPSDTCVCVSKCALG